MAGITGFGSYVPRYRLPREVIAKEWGQSSMGGERAVAGHDEDSLTLAVNAALNALPDGSAAGIDAIYFASTTPPFREKQSATTVAAVLDAGSAVRTTDVAASLRAGTTALRAALDAVQAGAKRALVCAGDCRMGEPDSYAEQNYGDAGAAVVIGGGDDVIAEVIGCYTQSEEFLGTWRADEQDFLHAFPGAFETKFGYAPFVIGAVQGLLKQTKTDPATITTAVVSAPNPRAVAGVAKALKLDAKKQVQDTLWTVIGDTGTTQPLLLLAAALERAKPGDLILLVGYGDGADALLLRATDAIASYKTGVSVFSQVERKRLLTSYGKYARFRNLIRKDSSNDDLTTPVVLFRDRRTVLSLHGGYCPKCGAVQFPRHRVCIECGQRDGLDERKLARQGTLFTFTNDYIHDSPDAPTTHGVVELQGGGRVYVQLTDVEADQVEVDMPVELTFRKYHEGSGVPNYFWKARPAA